MKHLDFMIIDMLCLQIAFILSYVIRHGLQNPYLDMDYRNLAIFIEVADIAIIYIFETFQDVLKRGYYQEFTVFTNSYFYDNAVVRIYFICAKNYMETDIKKIQFGYK